MREWWDKLSTREKAVMGGAALGLLLLVYIKLKGGSPASSGATADYSSIAQGPSPYPYYPVGGSAGGGSGGSSGGGAGQPPPKNNPPPHPTPPPNPAPAPNPTPTPIPTPVTKGGNLLLPPLTTAPNPSGSVPPPPGPPMNYFPPIFSPGSGKPVNAPQYGDLLSLLNTSALGSIANAGKSTGMPLVGPDQFQNSTFIGGGLKNTSWPTVPTGLPTGTVNGSPVSLTGTANDSIPPQLKGSIPPQLKGTT